VASGVDPGGARGAIAPPPIKIYLGESIFSPLKVLAELQKSCTKNAPQIAILRSKIKKKISGEGAVPSPQTPPLMGRGTPPPHTPPHRRLPIFGLTPLIVAVDSKRIVNWYW